MPKKPLISAFNFASKQFQGIPNPLFFNQYLKSRPSNSMVYDPYQNAQIFINEQFLEHQNIKQIEIKQNFRCFQAENCYEIKVCKIDMLMGELVLKLERRITYFQLQKLMGLIKQMSQKQIKKKIKDLKMLTARINYELETGEIQQKNLMQQAKQAVTQINLVISKKKSMQLN